MTKSLSEGRAWAFSIFTPSAQHTLNFCVLFVSLIDFKLMLDEIGYSNLKTAVFEKGQVGL